MKINPKNNEISEPISEDSEEFEDLAPEDFDE